VARRKVDARARGAALGVEDEATRAQRERAVERLLAHHAARGAHRARGARVDDAARHQPDRGARAFALHAQLAGATVLREHLQEIEERDLREVAFELAFFRRAAARADHLVDA